MVVALPVAWEAGRSPRRLTGLLAALTGLVGATVVTGLPFGLGRVLAMGVARHLRLPQRPGRRLAGPPGAAHHLHRICGAPRAHAVPDVGGLGATWRASTEWPGSGSRRRPGSCRGSVPGPLLPPRGAAPRTRRGPHVGTTSLCNFNRQRLLPASAVVAVLCSLAALLPWSNAIQVSPASGSRRRRQHRTGRPVDGGGCAPRALLAYPTAARGALPTRSAASTRTGQISCCTMPHGRGRHVGLDRRWVVRISG